MPWKWFERCLFLSFLLLFSCEAKTQTLKCEGFCFFHCELECKPQGAAISKAGFCEVMNRQGGSIRWSRDDTYETKARADLVNAAGKRLCGWKR